MPVELELGPVAQQFRDELRGWLEANKPGPDALAAAGNGRRGRLAPDGWTERLRDAGYLCVSWPKEFGGRGLSGLEVSVMNDEFARAGVPRVTRGMGEGLVGPAIIVWGTDEQKAYFLPRIIDGTDRYCQGFSEPDAGSDLAGLKTRGIVDGDELVITGQKVWTSGSQLANMIFVLCRTNPDAPKHRGISYVLCPMFREDGSRERHRAARHQAADRAGGLHRDVLQRGPGAPVQRDRRAPQRVAGHHDDARQRARR